MHIFCFLGFFFLVCAHKSTEEQAINKIQLHTRHNYKQEVLHMLKNDGWQSKFLSHTILQDLVHRSDICNSRGYPRRTK